MDIATLQANPCNLFISLEERPFLNRLQQYSVSPFVMFFSLADSPQSFGDILVSLFFRNFGEGWVHLRIFVMLTFYRCLEVLSCASPHKGCFSFNYDTFRLTELLDKFEQILSMFLFVFSSFEKSSLNEHVTFIFGNFRIESVSISSHTLSDKRFYQIFQRLHKITSVSYNDSNNIKLLF